MHLHSEDRKILCQVFLKTSFENKNWKYMPASWRALETSLNGKIKLHFIHCLLRKNIFVNEL